MNPHEDLAVECRCMVECGMSPMDVIVSLARNAADLLRVRDKVGTLEIGKTADVVLLSGNPLDDIAHIASVQRVFKSGAEA